MTGTTDRAVTDDPLARGAESTLSAALADLDDGCTVLVTGDVPDDAYRTAVSRYFGVPHRRRHRVLALTPDRADAERWLPEGIAPDDDDVAVVRPAGSVRDPAVASDPPEATGPGDATPDRLDLDGGDGSEPPEVAAAHARTALFDAIDRVGGDTDGRLRLRVGVHRVDTLCAAMGEDRAATLLRDVAETTRERGGMAHFHLPRHAAGDPRSDPVVEGMAEALGEELDVIVELRSRESSAVPEERWHILGWGRTEWNPLR